MSHTLKLQTHLPRPCQSDPVVDTQELQSPLMGTTATPQSGTGLGPPMSATNGAKKFYTFQAVNVLLSVIVWLLFPLSAAGFNLAYPVFALKVIALIWYNDCPSNKSFYSVMFFGFACADVLAIFLFGSFSIFSWGLSRLF